MKKMKLWVLGMATFAIVIACGPTLTTTKMTEKDLGNYQSFAYLPNTNFEVPDNLAGQKDKVGKSVIRAMNDNMKELGYTLNRENPDLLVLLTTKFDKERMRDVDAVYATYPYTTRYPVSPFYDPYYYYGYSNYGEFVGYDVDYSNYEVGTLIVDIIDRKTKNRLWSGTAEEAIYQNDTSAKITQYVDEIFDEYPAVSSD
ncbi:Putative lipoprotein [Croceitalea dokdonensis DOKDO 023]|uniref:Putative lipoprotein n=1 Tax=Croceitalea dokdonensis DOKDO 023 TaxID=1300341 RepID=A0A0P7B202_9FLAO|nr:DUF4136 domain-containing protein [Croceitalea dokdonensis]KPM32104.1 Putative lipoprotein [Croceitalea dokdonensis DOKDO 023]